MSVALRGAAGVANTASNTVLKPTGINAPQSGDFELFFGTRRLDASSQNGEPAAGNNGWTLLGKYSDTSGTGITVWTGSTATTFTLSIWWRVSSGSTADADYTFGATQTAGSTMMYTAWSGVDVSSTPGSAMGTLVGKTAASSTSHTVSTATEVVDGAAVYYTVTNVASTDVTWTQGSVGGQPTLTEIFEGTGQVSSVNRVSTNLSYAVTDSTGTSPAYTLTASNAGAYGQAVIILKPAASAVTATASLALSAALTTAAIRDRVVSASLAIAATLSSAASVSYAKLATLTDDFATKDTTKWTWSTNAAVSSGKATLPVAGSYVSERIYSNARYDLTSSEIVFEIPQAQVTLAGDGPFFSAELHSDSPALGASTEYIRFDLYASEVYARYRNPAGSQVTLTSGPPTWNPVTMRWIRIKHDGTNVTWSYSGDGASWTQFSGASVAAASLTMAMTALQVEFRSGGGSAATAYQVDNINGTAATWTTTASLALTGTLTTDATRTREAAASLALSAALSTAATKTAVPAASLPLVATLSAAATREQQTSATLALGVTLSAAAVRSGLVSGSLALTAALLAGTMSEGVTAGSLPISVDLATTALVGTVASLPLSIALATQAERAQFAAAALAVAVAMATDAMRTQIASGALNLDLDFTVASLRETFGDAALSLIWDASTDSTLEHLASGSLDLVVTLLATLRQGIDNPLVFETPTSGSVWGAGTGVSVTPGANGAMMWGTGTKASAGPSGNRAAVGSGVS